MSTLLIYLPAHTLAPQGNVAVGHALVEGSTVLSQGHGPCANLPKTQRAILVLAPEWCSWHHVQLPKLPLQKLRSVLPNLLEDQLLSDSDTMHVALPEQREDTSWLAAIDKSSLQLWLRFLNELGHPIDAAYPVAWPGQTPAQQSGQTAPTEARTAYGHFYHTENDERGQQATSVRLLWSSAEGVQILPLQGPFARQKLQSQLGDFASQAHWSASPAAATAAQSWLEAPVAVLPDAQRWLAATFSPWSLLQGALRPNSRGLQGLTRGARHLGQDPAWKAARWGMVAVICIGLFSLKWHHLSWVRAVANEQAAITQTVKTAFPDIPVVIDAPKQVQQGVNQWRERTGQLSQADFATVLSATSAAWPPNTPAAQSIRYERTDAAGFKLILGPVQWPGDILQTFNRQVQQHHLRASLVENALHIEAQSEGSP